MILHLNRSHSESCHVIIDNKMDQNQFYYYSFRKMSPPDFLFGKGNYKLLIVDTKTDFHKKNYEKKAMVMPVI